MFTLRRPTVFVPLVLTLVAVVIGAGLLLTRSGGKNLLSADRPNCPPVARNDAALTAPDQPVTVDVLANDSDVDGDKLEFTVINVSGGSAEVDFAGDGAQKLVYTPAADVVDGTTAKINYRATDTSGDVSTAVVTVAITSTGEMPAGLESASVGDANGEVLETRCLKVAKGKSTTTTETTEVVPASDEVPTDDVIVEGDFDEPSTGGSAPKTKSPRTTNARNVGGNDAPRPPRDDSGGSNPPDTPQTTRPPTTSPPPTSPPTTRCDAQCLRDRYDDNPDGPG